jgi:hypothetical protein
MPAAIDRYIAPPELQLSMAEFASAFVAIERT